MQLLPQNLVAFFLDLQRYAKVNYLNFSAQYNFLFKFHNENVQQQRNDVSQKTGTDDDFTHLSVKHQL